MGRAAFERRRRRWPLTAALFGVLLAAAASLVALAPGAGAQGDEDGCSSQRAHGPSRSTCT
ncbi:MAG: hypothetical protein R2749_17995 [Acidimicrobiales bacterium]